MEVWWRTSGRHLQSGHKVSGGGSDSQMPNVPLRRAKRHEKRSKAKMPVCLFFALFSTVIVSLVKQKKKNKKKMLLHPLEHNLCGLLRLTVLMLTLMTGIRERQDDVGSGLSALMFTLEKKQRTLRLEIFMH